MSNKIKLGDFNSLRVVKRVDFGIYLDGGEEGEILLPTRYVPEEVSIGDELEVFIYLDQDERLIATTEKPLAKVGDFAYLEVKWVNEYGAFLGWGLMKDLFCPFREQKKRMVLGQSYIVHVHIDEESYRSICQGGAIPVGGTSSLSSWRRSGLADLAEDRPRLQGHHRQPVPGSALSGPDIPVHSYRRQNERLYRKSAP